MNKLIQKVENWFVARRLHTLDGTGQLIKLHEEVEELVVAHRNNDPAEEKDAVGDITVVLIGYCLQRGYDFQDCLALAYEEIKDRKGQVINGVFVKE